jgi:hypothetical protein
MFLKFTFYIIDSKKINLKNLKKNFIRKNIHTLLKYFIGFMYFQFAIL